jgi:hypothetical protein
MDRDILNEERALHAGGVKLSVTSVVSGTQFFRLFSLLIDKQMVKAQALALASDVARSIKTASYASPGAREHRR